MAPDPGFLLNVIALQCQLLHHIILSYGLVLHQPVCNRSYIKLSLFQALFGQEQRCHPAGARDPREPAPAPLRAPRPPVAPPAPAAHDDPVPAQLRGGDAVLPHSRGSPSSSTTLWRGCSARSVPMRGKLPPAKFRSASKVSLNEFLQQPLHDPEPVPSASDAPDNGQPPAPECARLHDEQDDPAHVPARPLHVGEFDDNNLGPASDADGCRQPYKGLNEENPIQSTDTNSRTPSECEQDMKAALGPAVSFPGAADIEWISAEECDRREQAALAKAGCARLSSLDSSAAASRSGSCSTLSAAAPCSAPSATPSELKPGMAVTVHSLLAKPQMNGAYGHLTSWLSSKQRWAVDFGVAGGMMSIKPANLRPTGSCSLSAAPSSMRSTPARASASSSSKEANANETNASAGATKRWDYAKFDAIDEPSDDERPQWMQARDKLLKPSATTTLSTSGAAAPAVYSRHEASS